MAATKKAGTGRPASISAGRKEFDQALTEALELRALGEKLDQSRLTDELVAMGFSRSKGRLLVSHAFLRLMGSWEQFVEGLLLRFLTGATTPTGKPTLIGNTYATLDAAFAAVINQPGVKRGDDHMSWTWWAKVDGRARKFLTGGQPFASVLSPTGPDAPWYTLAVTVRNRVAHPSEHARNKFTAAARTYTGVAKLRKGYAAGEFLLEPAKRPPFAAKHVGKTVFEATAASMTDLADRLMA